MRGDGNFGGDRHIGRDLITTRLEFEHSVARVIEVNGAHRLADDHRDVYVGVLRGYLRPHFQMVDVAARDQRYPILVLIQKLQEPVTVLRHPEVLILLHEVVGAVKLVETNQQRTWLLLLLIVAEHLSKPVHLPCRHSTIAFIFADEQQRVDGDECEARAFEVVGVEATLEEGLLHLLELRFVFVSVFWKPGIKELLVVPLLSRFILTRHLILHVQIIITKRWKQRNSLHFVTNHVQRVTHYLLDHRKC